MDVQKFKELYKQINRFDQHMDYHLEIDDDGKVRYKCKIQEHHLSSSDTCHGGALAALMDNVLGVTTLAYAISQDKLCATVEFKINYLNPAMLGDELEGEAQIDFKGNRLVVASGFLKTKEKLIVKGIGTFNLYPASKRDFFGLETAPSS